MYYDAQLFNCHGSLQLFNGCGIHVCGGVNLDLAGSDLLLKLGNLGADLFGYHLLIVLVVEKFYAVLRKAEGLGLTVGKLSFQVKLDGTGQACADVLAAALTIPVGLLELRKLKQDVVPK